MSLITRLFSRGSSEQVSGAIRIGGAEYNTDFAYGRILRTVYKNPTGFRCIEDTANEFMRPDWGLYDAKNKNDLVEDHPFLDVLENPFERATGTTMQYHISRDLDLSGGTFLVKMRGKDWWGNNGPLTGLKRIPPQRVTVMTGDDDELLGFVYVDRQGRRAPILPDEMVYIHFPDGDREWHRQPPAEVAGMPADLDNAAMKFNAELLDNDGGLPGYLVVDGLTPDAFSKWVANWRSGESPGKTRVLSSQGSGPGGGGRGNATYVRVGVSNQEMMYDVLRKMSQEDICLAFGYPPVLLNPDGTTYANMDVARRSWIIGRLLPRWVWVRDAMNVQLKDDLPDGIKIGFNLETIEELTENLDAIVARELAILNDAKAQTVNQFLEKIGREPVPWGNEEPKALVPVVDPENDDPTDEEKPKEKPEKSTPVGVSTKGASTFLQGINKRVDDHEAITEKAMTDFYLAQGRAIANRILSKKGKAYRKAVEDWWDGEKWRSEATSVIYPVFEGAVNEVGKFAIGTFVPGSEFDTTSKNIKTYLLNQTRDVANLVNETTKEEVRVVLADLAQSDRSVDELADGVLDYFADNAKMRATRFARTEMIGAANFASEEAAKQTGLHLVKRISHAGDADADCTSLAGERVELDGTFSNGKTAPPIHPNCRCCLEYDEVEEVQ